MRILFTIFVFIIVNDLCEWKVCLNPSFVPAPGTASVLVQFSLVVPGTVSILGVQLVPGAATMSFSCVLLVPGTTKMSSRDASVSGATTVRAMPGPAVALHFCVDCKNTVNVNIPASRPRCMGTFECRKFWGPLPFLPSEPPLPPLGPPLRVRHLSSLPDGPSDRSSPFAVVLTMSEHDHPLAARVEREQLVVYANIALFGY